MKPLGWIAALGLLSGGPACAEVLWTPLGEENPESSDSFDEDWIDPFSKNPNQKEVNRKTIQWVPVIQQSLSADREVNWSRELAPKEDRPRSSEINVPVYEQQAAPQIPLLGASKRPQWVLVGHEVRPEGFATNLQEDNKHPIKLPPPPALETLDRSIAFSDDFVGPDISWNIPNGLRWSQRWFGSASVLGQSRRRNEGPFRGWNDGDAVSIIHANLLQTTDWSFGLNTSFRSIYQGDDAAGGGTRVGEGFSTGFRVARQWGDTAGIALGGEQVIQWDDKTDTGRNLYLMTTKGWWLGDKQKTYPLLIANMGIGTGRFANQDINSFTNPYRFGCIKNFENRKGTFRVDNDLCWSPIGSAAIVINPWWSIFTEYRSGTAQAATSVSLNDGLPIRLTWGVNFLGKNEYVKNENLTWVFRASLGF